MLNISRVIILLSLLGLSTEAATQKVELLKEKSSVTFVAIGRPSAMKIHGENAKPEGSLLFSVDGAGSGQIKVDLDEFTTGMSLRDRHMKEKYLETNKDGNKFATIEISKVDFPSDFWSSQKTGEFTFQGTLALHGSKKAIEGKLKVTERKLDQLQGSSAFSIKLTDYGIQIPSFSGITVAENVEIQVSFEAKITSVK
jgi:polyisoprenoid-binding protein YceI